MMCASGDRVRLPHGRGIGLVLQSHDGEAAVYVGRRSDRTPIVDRYIECELAPVAGRPLRTLARLILSELDGSKQYEMCAPPLSVTG